MIQFWNIRQTGEKWDHSLLSIKLFSIFNNVYHQHRLSHRIVMHPDYHGGPSANDIVLMKLKEPLVFGRGVSAACLPKQDDEADLTQRNCMLTGWGLTKGPQDSTKLQQVKKAKEIHVG
jgi:hypothetical protein